jgi:hypothetical protein
MRGGSLKWLIGKVRLNDGIGAVGLASPVHVRLYYLNGDYL